MMIEVCLHRQKECGNGMIGMRAEDLDGTMEGIKIDMSVHMICITLEVVILVEVEVEAIFLEGAIMAQCIMTVIPKE